MTKITTLIENHCAPESQLKSEHGLSFFIEHNKQKILFDTGSSDTYLRNAQKLNVNLSRTQAIVVSHGHYDHANGLPFFYQTTGLHTPLFVGAGFFDRKYKINPEGRSYLGLSYTYDDLQKQGIPVTQLFAPSATETVSLQIAEGVHVLRGFTQDTDYEVSDHPYVVERLGEYPSDDFSDEVCLVIETAGTLVVILGCAHPGPVNMLKTVSKYFNKKISTVLGGIHLGTAKEDRIKKTLEYLTSLELDCLGLAHCSGDKAISLSKDTAPFFYLNQTGSSIVL